MKHAVLILALSTAAHAGAVTLRDPGETPVEGRPVTLTLAADDGSPAAGLTVSARYRENAHEKLRSEQAIGTTDSSGNVEWRPERAGVVVIAWEGGRRNLSVLHDGPQPGAVVVSVLAGVILLGGSVLFFVQMLRKDRGRELMEEVADVGEPPST